MKTLNLLVPEGGVEKVQRIDPEWRRSSVGEEENAQSHTLLIIIIEAE